MNKQQIPLTELIDFFGECTDVRFLDGEPCSFEIDYESDCITLIWNKNLSIPNLLVLPFDKNKTVSIDDKGVVELFDNEGFSYDIIFTKTLTLRDFR